jgi:hypothetical protein
MKSVWQVTPDRMDVLPLKVVVPIAAYPTDPIVMRARLPLVPPSEECGVERRII